MRILLLTILLAAAPFTDPLLAAGTPSDRMTRIEHGLRPGVTIEGDAPWTLEERMRHYEVPAVSIAVIQDFKVVAYRVYGLADRETGEKATGDTLFQAGSVSKPVAAFGALKMVETGKLTLDGNINDTLKSWKLPDNEFTKEAKVTLTHLLAHTGGLTVHGFPGYAVREDVPSTIQVLDGSGPANTPPIRVDKVPGESFRYSGGGYTIAQLMRVDADGWDEGFCASLTAHRSAGYGAVVMINSNHPQLADEIVRGIAEEYGWAGYAPYPKLELQQAALELYPGRYRYNAEQAFTIERRGDRLFMHYVEGRESVPPMMLERSRGTEDSQPAREGKRRSRTRGMRSH